MANNDRFDLEQNIMHCWNVVDDLNMLVEMDTVSADTVQAVATLYQQKFEYLWENFENCCANKFKTQYDPDYSDNVIDRSQEAREQFNKAFEETDVEIAKRNLENGLSV